MCAFRVLKIINSNVSRIKGVVGTLYTMAPEVLKGDAYDSSCDMWSIGVMTYLLLSGDMPFDCSTKQRLIQAVEDGHYEFSGKRWGYISPEARWAKIAPVVVWWSVFHSILNTFRLFLMRSVIANFGFRISGQGLLDGKSQQFPVSSPYRKSQPEII